MRAVMAPLSMALSVVMLLPAGTGASAVQEPARAGFWDRLGNKLMPPPDKDAIRFCNELLQSHNRVAEAVQVWQKAVGEALSVQASKEVNKDVTAEDVAKTLAALRTAQTELEKIAETAISDVKKVKPHESKSGKALLDAQLKYLEAQSRTFHEDFAAIVKIVEDEKTPAADRIKRVREANAKALSAETEKFKELISLQRAFAREFYID